MPDGEVSDSGHRSLFQATKNPIILNLKGGIIGLHKMGTSKKSSGTNSDCGPQRKFWPRQKNQNIFIADPSLPLIDQPSIPGHSTTMSEPASVNSTLAMA